MSQYDKLAPFYDRLNPDVDYDGLTAYFCRALNEHGIAPDSLILDAACGTGSMTLRMAKAGYDMIGIDLSPEMLSEAREKCANEGVFPLFLCQSLTEIDLYGTVKGALCTLDSLNYLTGEGELEKCFSLLHNYIEPGGLLFFDMNTPHKFETVYADNAYILEDDNVFCGWQNDYNRRTHLCTFTLTFFEKLPNGNWKRSEEVQTERCYSTKWVKTLLRQVGFELIAHTADLCGSPATDSDERHYYLCKRI